MPPIGSLKNMTESLREKTTQDRQQMEKIVSEELTNLQRNLSDATRSALNTIRADMDKEIRAARETAKGQMNVLSGSFCRRWLMTALTALAALLGLTLGGWGLTALAGHHIKGLRSEIGQLNQRKEALESATRQLQAQTWGLSLRETPEGRFIILPPGTSLKPGWTMGQNQAVKVE